MPLDGAWPSSRSSTPSERQCTSTSWPSTSPTVTTGAAKAPTSPMSSGAVGDTHSAVAKRGRPWRWRRRRAVSQTKRLLRTAQATTAPGEPAEAPPTVAERCRLRPAMPAQTPRIARVSWVTAAGSESASSASAPGAGLDRDARPGRRSSTTRTEGMSRTARGTCTVSSSRPGTYASEPLMPRSSSRQATALSASSGTHR
mmetsp:Transcript_15018/g.56607  ORF Transcript_15018/g.56607 Transcript_15018/m.56607 type:complete len:200 (-) Transcript_15018:236-835(-)